MRKKYGFDGTNYPGRKERKQLQRPRTDLSAELTASFKKATGAAAKAAWDENLAVPCVVNGRTVYLMPDGKRASLKSKS
jgi:hypothetical protein